MPPYPSGGPHQRTHQASVGCKNLTYIVGLMQYGCSARAAAEQDKQLLPAYQALPTTYTFWPDFLTNTDCAQGSCSHKANMTERYKSYSSCLNNQQLLRINQSSSKDTELFWKFFQQQERSAGLNRIFNHKSVLWSTLIWTKTHCSALETFSLLQQMLSHWWTLLQLKQPLHNQLELLLSSEKKVYFFTD